MKFLKSNKNKFIAIILVITSLSTLFAMTGNAYQMGGPSYYTESGVNLYRIYIWNEDNTNTTNSTPYKLHADLEFMNSSYDFAIVFSSIRRWSYSENQYIDEEQSFILYNLNPGNLENRENAVWDWYHINNFTMSSVSDICDSSHSTVADAYKDDTGRETNPNKFVLARANYVVGTIYPNPGQNPNKTIKLHAKKISVNTDLIKTYFTISYYNYYNRVWEY